MYRCRKCRKLLFQALDLIHVDSGCTSVFVEHLDWIAGEQVEGVMKCPGCGFKIGEICFWGRKCSCGKWVVPGFQIQRSRIDEGELMM